jgi:hypothetical protein
MPSSKNLRLHHNSDLTAGLMANDFSTSGNDDAISSTFADANIISSASLRHRDETDTRRQPERERDNARGFHIAMMRHNRVETFLALFVFSTQLCTNVTWYLQPRDPQLSDSCSKPHAANVTSSPSSLPSIPPGEYLYECISTF